MRPSQQLLGLPEDTFHGSRLDRCAPSGPQSQGHPYSGCLDGKCFCRMPARQASSSGNCSASSGTTAALAALLEMNALHARLQQTSPQSLLARSDHSRPAHYESWKYCQVLAECKLKSYRGSECCMLSAHRVCFQQDSRRRHVGLLMTATEHVPLHVASQAEGCCILLNANSRWN